MKRQLRWLAVVVVVLALGLAGLRALAPIWALDRANAALAQLGPYRGSVEDVDLWLWRGGYRLSGLRIEKRSGTVEIPLVRDAQVDVQIGWPALITGRGTATVEVRGAQVAFVDADSEPSAQFAEGVPWRYHLEQLAPVPIAELRLHESTFAFHYPGATPPVELVAAGAHGRIVGLAGTGDARLEGAAQVQGHAPLSLEMHFPARGVPGKARIGISLEDLRVVEVNDFLRAYAGVDAAAGTASVSVSAIVEDARIDGEARLQSDGIEVFGWKQDVEADDSGPVQMLREAAAGLAFALVTSEGAGRRSFSAQVEPESEDGFAALLTITRTIIARAAEPLLRRETALSRSP